MVLQMPLLVDWLEKGGAVSVLCSGVNRCL